MARHASTRSRLRRGAPNGSDENPVSILKARKKPGAGRPAGGDLAPQKGAPSVAEQKSAPSRPLQQLRGANGGQREHSMGHLVPPAAAGLSPAKTGQRLERPSPSKEGTTRAAVLQKTGHGHAAEQHALKQGGRGEQRPIHQDAGNDQDSMEDDPMDIFFSSHPRASQLPGAIDSTKGRSNAAAKPVPAARSAGVQESDMWNLQQHQARGPAPGLHPCSDKDQRKRRPEPASAWHDVRPLAWKGNEGGCLPDQLAAGALDAAPLLKRPKTGATPPDSLRSPPAAKAQASHNKVNPKYSSPSPGFWEEAIQLCSEYNFPVLNQMKAAVQEPAGASPVEGRGSSRAGPRPEVGQATVVCQQSKQAQEAILSPAPVRHFDFDDCAVNTTKHEMGGPAGPPLDKTDHCHGALTRDVHVPPPDTSVPVKDASPDPPLEVVAGPAVVERALGDANQLAGGGPALFEQQVRQNSRGSEDSVLGSGGVLDGSGGRGKANEVGTSALSAEELEREKELSHWLPDEACEVYARKGVTRMYEWQVKCLRTAAVLNGQNLVYSASTSAGKSLVAEVLLIRRVIDTGKKALLVLPFVSICHEKSNHMESIFEPLGFKVRNFFGNQGGSTLQEDTSLAVCTIEKANTLVNKLLEDGRLGELGIIVIDEIHMVGDPARGYLLELLLTKLRYAAGLGSSPSQRSASKGKGKSSKKGRRDGVLSPLQSPTRGPGSSGKMEGEGLQIVGMSATMANTKDVAKWLNAELYETDFRPVPLEEYIKVGPVIMRPDLTPVRTLPVKADREGQDTEYLVELCDEVVRDGHSVLVFCASRAQCESVAGRIANLLPPLAPSERALTSPTSPGECVDAEAVVDALKRAPGGIDKVLQQSVPKGVAYHHAGLTGEEREILERAYKKGIIRVLTATSTLAAGVNLPARRVIFRTPKVGLSILDGTQYRQMCGRAGRAGIDSKGESILMCNSMQEAKRMSEIILAGCKDLKSCISEEKNGMGRALLEVVASKIVQTPADVLRYVRCTLLRVMNPEETVHSSAKEALKFLCQQRLVEWTEDSLYVSTPLGDAAFGSSLTPDDCIWVHKELMRARSEGLVLSTDLHLVYLVTPTNVQIQPDWGLYYRRYMELTDQDRKVAERVGVTEGFLARRAQHGSSLRFQSRPSTRATSRGGQKAPAPSASKSIVLGDGERPKQDPQESLRICERFFVALIICQLIQEKNVDEVCSIFDQNRGTVQGLQEQAGAFAAMITAFCERMGWADMHALLGKFQQRVAFGVKAEIAELTEIPFVKAGRARALCKAGLRSAQAVAEASSREIAKIISSWGRGNSGEAPNRTHLMIAGKIKAGARKIVMEKAEEAKRAAFSSFRALGVVIPPELEKALAAPLPSPGQTPAESPAEDSPPPESAPALPSPATLPALPAPQHQTPRQQAPAALAALPAPQQQTPQQPAPAVLAALPAPQQQTPQQPAPAALAALPAPQQETPQQPAPAALAALPAPQQQTPQQPAPAALAALPAPQQPSPQNHSQTPRHQLGGNSVPRPVAGVSLPTAPEPAPGGLRAGLSGVGGEVQPRAGMMFEGGDRGFAPQQLVAPGAHGVSIGQGTGMNEAAQREMVVLQAPVVAKAELVVERQSSMYSSKAWQSTMPTASGSHGAGNGKPEAAQQQDRSGRAGVESSRSQAGPTGHPDPSSHTAQRGQAGHAGYAAQPPQGAAQNLRLGQVQNRHDGPPQKKARVEGAAQAGADVAARAVHRYAHTHQLVASAPRRGAADFVGHEVLKPSPQGDGKAAKQGTRQRPHEGPVDVDGMPGGFEAFMELWGAQTEYAVDFHAGKEREAEGGGWTWELEGVAVCWKGSSVYYISIKTPPISSPEHPGHQGPARAGEESPWAHAVKARWGRVAGRLCSGQGRAVVWHLQHWLKVLAKAFVLAPPKRGAPRPAPGEDVSMLDRFFAGEQNVGVKLKSVRGNLPAGQMQLKHGGKGPLPGGKIDLKHMAATGDAGGGTEGVALEGLPGPWQVVDTMLLVWILEPVDTDRSLEKAVELKLPAEAAGLASRAGRWQDQTTRASKDGCCRRAAQARALHELLWKNLFAEGLERPLMDIETPLATVLAQMEVDGVAVNVSECRRLRRLLRAKLVQLQKRGRELSGERNLCLSNPGEVSVVLYKKLGLPIPEGARGTRGHLSTSGKYLDQLSKKHPLPGVIKEFRSLAKMTSSTFTHFITLAKEYKGSPHRDASVGKGEGEGGPGSGGGSGEVLGALSLNGEAGTSERLDSLDFDTCSSPLLMEESEDPAVETTALMLEKEGPNRHKIFGRWFQAQSSTGRISMGENNNLQCVEKPVTFTLEVPVKPEDPKAEGPVEEEGSRAKGPKAEQQDGRGGQATTREIECEVNPRALLVPSQKGRVMIGADYSQIEIRLMAHFSGDEKLIAQLSDPKADLFTHITANTMAIPQSSVTEKDRGKTKGLVYGILYGMGLQTLSERMECSKMQADVWRTSFLQSYPGVHSWLESTVRSCKESGYVCTLMGRRRYLDMINNGNSSDQARAERQAVNSLPQGSAADLIKMAMLRLHSVVSGRPIPPLPFAGQSPDPSTEAVPSTGEQGQRERCTPFVLPVGVSAQAHGGAGQGGRSTGGDQGADFVPGQPNIGGARTADEAREAARFYHVAGRCRLLLQIHDELVAEADEAVTADAARLLAWSMESVANLKVPLRVKVKVGDSWGGLKSYSLS